MYWNDEYEPQLARRDDAVESAPQRGGIAVRRFHDRLLVPPGAVATKEGMPFVVYTPFRRACEAFTWVGQPIVFYTPTGPSWPTRSSNSTKRG